MFHTIMTAKVNDNNDLDGLHRVRVILSDGFVTGWIPYSVPLVAQEAGFWVLPDIDEQVLVAVLDPLGSSMIVIGGFWYEGLPPPETGENTGADLNQDGKNTLHFMKNKAGSILVFDDSEGAEKLQIIGPDNNSRLEFGVGDESIILKAEKDISIRAEKNLALQSNEVELTTEKSISFTCESLDGDIKETATVGANQEFALKGSGLSLN